MHLSKRCGEVMISIQFALAVHLIDRARISISPPSALHLWHKSHNIGENALSDLSNSQNKTLGQSSNFPFPTSNCDDANFTLFGTKIASRQNRKHTS